MSALSPRDQIAAFVLLVVLLAGVAVLARRLAAGLRDQVLVRCRDGHLFNTTWIPYATVSVVRRREEVRYQYCPVGRHWSLITPVPNR
jgi:hypothetical protein